jgi:integrase
VEWCEGVGIDRVGDLERYDLDEYYELRSAKVAPATLEGGMWTLKMFIRFLEDLGAVEDGLAEAVRIPDLDQADRSDDTKLHTDAAIALLRYYQDSDTHYGTRWHVMVELAWVTGARQGGLRGLDLQDCELGESPYVEFRHRPETGTPLKNKLQGERPVALKRTTADAVQEYIDEHRWDVRDDNGRQPLFTTPRGRPVKNTLRVWCYQATQPCLHMECPHGKQRETCQWTDVHHASKCPSSRSPHQLRTGAITYLLNQGWPPEDVAERVNSTVETIEQHYDKADPEERRRRLRERMEDRRRSLVENTEFDHDQ